jgi:hypothetical protein
MILRRFGRAILVPAILVTITTTVRAEIKSVGGSLPERPSNWNAAAFDPVNNVYLVTLAGAPVTAKFVSQNGVGIGPIFGIAAANEGYASWSSTSFGSASDPAFLVTYTVNFANGACTHNKYGRIVRYNNGSPTVSPRIFITTNGCQWNFSERAQSVWTGAAWVVGTQIDGTVYNLPFATAEVRTVDYAGNVSSGHDLGDPANPDYFGSPSIACKTDGTVCMATGFANGYPLGLLNGRGVYARLFNGSTLEPITNVLYVDGHLSNQQNHNAVYNPKTDQFVAIWWRAGLVDTRTVTTSGALGVLNENVLTCAVCGASGLFAGDVKAVSNPTTGTILLVTKQFPADLYAFEIDDNATQLGGPLLVSTWDGSWPEYDPSIAADSVNGRWFVTAVENTGRALLVQGGDGKAAPVVTTHPTTQRTAQGQLVTLTARASGGPAPSVKWQVQNVGSNSWTDISGAADLSYAFWAAPRDNNKKFRAVFTNSQGVAISQPATVTVTGITATDFDGDGQADLLVWRASTGTWFWANSANGFTTGGSKQFGNQSMGDVPLTGDIDGDGKPDAIVWRASSGTWYWATSSSGFTNGSSKQWGNQGLGDVPLLGDFDGDGRADLVVWRASTGTWYWTTSSSSYTNGSSRQWGNVGLGDQPLIGDFDGDGKADPAVWRASSGAWYWLTSSSGLQNGFMVQQFGNTSLGDKPLVGDIDGDGRSDMVIWRGSSGRWFWRGSLFNFADGGSAAAFLTPIAGDTPLLSDIDGDGHADLIQFRPSDGIWHWVYSSALYASGGSQPWGNVTLGDVPLIR